MSGQVSAPPTDRRPPAGRPDPQLAAPRWTHRGAARRGGPAPRRRSTAASRRTTRTGLALISPALAFVTVFALFPLGFGVYISLTNWPLVGAYHYIGLANYTALMHNSVFLQSILFTLEYTAIVTLPILVIGYALAVFVRANRPGSTVFRTMIFVPYIVGLVAESFMAVVELQPDSGTVELRAGQFRHRQGVHRLDGAHRAGADRDQRAGHLVRRPG